MARVFIGSRRGAEDSLLHRALGGLARFLYTKSKHIVVVTPAFKERLIDDWNISPEKISVVENGVETDFSPHCRNPQFSNVGKN